MKRLGLSILLAGVSSTVASVAVAETQRVIVTIENLAPTSGTFQTPHWVGFHDGVFDIYDGGTPANNDPIAGDPLNSVERLAEDGNTAPLSETFAGLVPEGVDATIAGPNGAIAPGDVTSQSFLLDSTNPNQRYFSYASMVLPSNDFWYANGNPQTHPIFNDSGAFVAQDFIVNQDNVLDAGTEVNDEVPANTAFFGQQAPNTGVDEGGVIRDFRDDAGNPQLSFLPRGSGGILDDARFRMGDFVVRGYPLVKISFGAAPAITDNLRFVSKLTGSQEVPTVATRDFGIARYALRQNGTQLRFRHVLTVPVQDITMAHLHLGAKGENGPVIAQLFNDANRSERLTEIQRRNRSSSSRLRGTLTSNDVTGPLAGLPLDRIIAEMNAGNVYINIHTEDDPAGHIRGQVY